MSHESGTPVVSEAPARPRRRRGLIAAVVIVVVIVVLLIVADSVARGIVAKKIESQVRTAASVPATTPIDVTVSGASVLLQLATGRLDNVTVSVKDLGVGALHGDAVITATGVPIDMKEKMTSAQVAFTVDESQLRTLVSGYSAVKISALTLKNGAVNISTEFSVLGLKLPVAVALSPTAVNGKLVLTPQSVTVGGRTLTTAEVRSNFGSIAENVLKPQGVCVAKYLPRVLSLQSIVVHGTTVTLTVAGSNIPLDTSLLRTKGVCS